MFKWFLKNEKLNSKTKLSNNSSSVILIFAILKNRHIARSTFHRSKFWTPPTASNLLNIIRKNRPGLAATRGKLSQWLYWEKNLLERSTGHILDMSVNANFFGVQCSMMASAALTRDPVLHYLPRQVKFDSLSFHAPRGLDQPCLVALCKKSTRNQPISNPDIGKPTVGFAKTNRVPTFVYHSL